jgi:carbohydrate diacid regulator
MEPIKELTKAITILNSLLESTISRVPNDELTKDISFHGAGVVFAIRVEDAYKEEASEIVKNLFPQKSEFRIIEVGPNYGKFVLLFSKTKQNQNKIAKTIAETITGELMITVQIGIGEQADTQERMSNAITTAVSALETGSIFYGGKPYHQYDEQFIARIIMNLPANILIDLNEKVQMLDESMITVANLLFENNLNISETARAAYLHRNTLTYRLNRICKLTGLDILKFEDSLIFKMAVMAKIYLEERQSTYDKDK